MNVDIFRSVVSEFLENIGVKPTSYGEMEMIDITLEDSGRFFVELCESGVLASLGRKYDALTIGHMIKILQSCDFRLNPHTSLYSGIHNDNTIFYVVRIPEHSVEVHQLHSEIGRLSHMHDELHAECEK